LGEPAVVGEAREVLIATGSMWRVRSHRLMVRRTSTSGPSRALECGSALRLAHWDRASPQ
jgi:hypothetical protein